MFCSNCGNKLDEGVKFCTNCGTKVERPSAEEPKVEEPKVEEPRVEEPKVEESKVEEPKVEEIKPEPIPAYTDNNSGNNSGNTNANNSNNANNSKSFNWKEYFTKENIERFAPAAALLPLAMAIVVGILSGVLFSTVGSYGVGRVICRIIVGLLKFLFVAVTIGAAAGLIYVAVNFKDKNLVKTWVAPAVVVVAALSCIGIAFHWSVFAWITGIVAVIMGIEFLARIVIANQPMDSDVQPATAVEAYKQYYKNYRAKYPTSKDLEKNGYSGTNNSFFDGPGIELFGYTILTGLVSAVTCGIAAPWMICMVYKWRMQHTVINGRRLTFTGIGTALFGHWILWEILTIVTCGIYGFFVPVALRKWQLKNTFIEGEPVVVNAEVSFFDGGTAGFIGYTLLGSLILTITCGLAYPWVMVMMQKWDTKHQVINGRRLAFTGTGLGFLGEYIIIFLLTIITCGIYSAWGQVRMYKYITRHTDFIN